MPFFYPQILHSKQRPKWKSAKMRVPAILPAVQNGEYRHHLDASFGEPLGRLHRLGSSGDHVLDEDYPLPGRHPSLDRPARPVILGGPAHYDVRQASLQGSGDRQRHGPKFHASQPLHVRRQMTRQLGGHAPQQARFGAEEVLIEVETAALPARENEVSLQKRGLTHL